MTTTITVRRARPDEHAALSALAFASKAHWGYSAEFMDACRAELTYSADDIRHRLFHVAVDGDTLVGFHALVRTSADVLDLDALFVRPDAIGRGHGRLLLEHALALAAETGAVELIVQSDPHALDFYTRAGARLVGERVSDSVPGRQLPLLSFPVHARYTASDDMFS